MDKRTKDCYDEVMICHGVDNFNCKAFENIVAVLSRYLEREKVKDNETVLIGDRGAGAGAGESGECFSRI